MCVMVRVCDSGGMCLLVGAVACASQWCYVSYVQACVYVCCCRGGSGCINCSKIDMNGGMRVPEKAVYDVFI